MSATDRLDEIQIRADNATDGPWWGSMISGHVEVFAGTGSGSDPMLATELLPGDAEFVVNARTDVPRLVAALRRVLKACDELEANIPYDNGNATANHAGRTIRRAIADALGEGS